jgi:hypothetical protein
VARYLDCKLELPDMDCLNGCSLLSVKCGVYRTRDSEDQIVRGLAVGASACNGMITVWWRIRPAQSTNLTIQQIQQCS